MKVAPTCTGAKGMIKYKRRSVSESFPKEYLPQVDISKTSVEVKEVLVNEKNEDGILNQIDQTTLLDDKPPEHSDVDKVDVKAVKQDISLDADRTIISELHHNISFTTSEVGKKIIVNDLHPGSLAQVLYDYFATNPEDVNIHEGEHVIIVKKGNERMPDL
jgi:hypothetical protein